VQSRETAAIEQAAHKVGTVKILSQNHLAIWFDYI